MKANSYCNRRTMLAAGLASIAMAMLASGFPRAALAQDKYPSRPITLVVGFSAGGQSDVLARMLATRLGPILGQPVVVVNKVGAASTMAYSIVAGAEADGYTLMLGGGSGMVMAPLVMKVSYDAVKDFRSVAMLTIGICAIAVNSSVPANNLSELVALIKANPGKYSWGTSGFGGIDHLTGELFKQKAGNLDLLHVPYKGGGPALNDLIGGHIPISITTLSGLYSTSKSGKIRILAVTADKRSPAAPEIPTAIEAGVPFTAETFNLVTAPARTPAPVIETLRAAVAKVMTDPTFISELSSLGYEPVTESTPAGTDEYIKNQLEKWRQVVTAAKIAPE